MSDDVLRDENGNPIELENGNENTFKVTHKEIKKAFEIKLENEKTIKQQKAQLLIFIEGNDILRKYLKEVEFTCAILIHFKEIDEKYIRQFRYHSDMAVEFMNKWIKEHNGSYKGWYSRGDNKRSQIYLGSKKWNTAKLMIWNYFLEKRKWALECGNHYMKYTFPLSTNNKVLCHFCRTELNFDDFIPHHTIPYAWNELWFPILENREKIVVCCKRCHKKGDDKDWWVIENDSK